MRGLVATPAVRITAPQKVRTGAANDLQQLRTWLLYWDKMVDAMPEGAMFAGLPPEYEYLEHVGLFSRQPIHGLNGELSALIIEARSRRFKDLEKASPGSWAVASSQDSWDGVSTGDQRSLRVKLMSALPVPDQDVALDDILSFRERRQAERDALMSHIDDVYQSIISAADKPLAEHSAIEKLAAGARDQLETWQETKLPFRLMNIAADFNIVPAVTVALGTVSLGSAWPMVVGNSLLAGGSVTIEKLLGLWNPKQTDTPFRYITSYHHDVFRPE